MKIKRIIWWVALFLLIIGFVISAWAAIDAYYTQDAFLLEFQREAIVNHEEFSEITIQDMPMQLLAKGIWVQHQIFSICALIGGIFSIVLIVFLAISYYMKRKDITKESS